jgi:peptidoglycan/LPS O-acetylase OafA/YrhL
MFIRLFVVLLHSFFCITRQTELNSIKLFDNLIPKALITKEARPPLPENLICEIKTDILLSAIFNSTFTLPSEYSDFYKFAMYSGTGINDLGDYFNCVDMSYSSYYLITLKLQGPQIMRMGICYFKECDVAYLDSVKSHILNLIHKYTNMTIDSSKIFFTNSEQATEVMQSKYHEGMIIVCVILGLILCLHIFAIIYISQVSKKESLIVMDETSLEEHNNQNQLSKSSDKRSKSFLFIFCNFFHIFQNGNKLFTVINANRSAEYLRVFDGVRVLSTMWVVLCHTYYVPLSTGGFKNTSELPDLAKKFKFSLLISGFFSVDVFFFLSAFLLSLSFQKYFNKPVNSIKKLKLFFISILTRYLRLLPLYLFAIYGITYLIPFFKNGPNYHNVEDVNKYCSKYGWHNLLYINNVIDYKVPETMCGMHTWYLANDMQFFILSLIVFLVLGNYRKLRFLFLFLICIASNILSTLISIDKKYTYDDFNHYSENQETFFYDFYVKPWIRIPPYIIGLFFCELFVDTPLYKEDNPADPKETRSEARFIQAFNRFFIKNNWACWVLFIGSILAINYAVFTPYFTNNYDLGYSTAGFFQTMNKFFFVGALGCILHLTFLGKFDFIRKILSIPLFSWVGRFTFGVYLIHYYLVTAFWAQLPMVAYLNMSDLAFLALGFFVFSLLLSGLLSLFIESPIINMTKALLIQRKRNDKEE